MKEYFYIDSHCHLNHNRLLHEGGAESMIKNAKDANVQGLLTISCRIAQEYDTLLGLAQNNDNVWCTVGTHPHDADDENETAISLEKLMELSTADPNIIGIGESGLDYFYKNASVEGQKESFRKHIRACMETGLPLVIHARDADDDILQILKEEGAGPNSPLKGVLHCFSSGRDLAMQGVEMGFYVSFSGIVTFKKSQELRDIAADLPLERLLVETDAPYLAPEPHRGAMNMPEYVVHTAACLAQIHNKTREEMAAITSDNFFTLFDKAKETWVNPQNQAA